jgi:hypothetical protein
VPVKKQRIHEAKIWLGQAFEHKADHCEADESGDGSGLTLEAMDSRAQQQAERIDKDTALAAPNLLARIKSRLFERPWHSGC